VHGSFCFQTQDHEGRGRLVVIGHAGQERREVHIQLIDLESGDLLRERTEPCR
jgi:hypothetical protein